MIVGNAISKTFFLLLAAGAQANDVRFEKFDWTGVPQDITFPIDQLAEAEYLRQNSRSISVLYGETCDIDLDQVLTALGDKGLYPPTHPEHDEFWPEFDEVVKVQYYVQQKEQNRCNRDAIADVMPAMTQLWKGFGILDVAEAVHDEMPGIYHNQMIANWLAIKDPDDPYYVKGRDIIPKNGMVDFLRGPVFLSDMVGYAIRAVGDCNFTLKWMVGRARPEEVAYKVRTGQIADVPRYIQKPLRSINFDTATEFTAYDEGSPTHPSWPAMHSAASAGSYWLDITMDLSPEQLCDARMLDYSVSYARTVAGVHYRTDNEAGLMAGQEILYQTLPTYLNEVYGADMNAVKQRAEDRKYDWTRFTEEDAEDCYNKQRFRTEEPELPKYCIVI